jgi:uncharacterized protein
MTHSGMLLTPHSAEDVFALVANPERFAPLLPNYESMSMLDATHFALRIVVTVGQIDGHVLLPMELVAAARPFRVEYRGQGTVAGSELYLGIGFQIAAEAEATEVRWQGEVTLEGTLAVMAGNLLETIARRNFDLMAERVHDALREASSESAAETPSSGPPPDLDFEI